MALSKFQIRLKFEICLTLLLHCLMMSHEKLQRISPLLPGLWPSDLIYGYEPIAQEKGQIAKNS